MHSDRPMAADGAVRVAVVHIGTHKTGTTSFQVWAERNRAYLEEHLDLKYYNGLFGSNHYELPLLCIDRHRSMSMRAKIPDWCLDAWQVPVREHLSEEVEQDARQLLISCEDFSYARSTGEVQALQSLLAPRELSVVVTLREPQAFLRSYANELRTQGFELSSIQGSFAYVESDSWLVDYDRMLSVYRSVLGPDHVYVVDYEAAMREDGSTLPSVMAGCGVRAEELPDWQRFRFNASDTRARRMLGRLRRARRHLG